MEAGTGRRKMTRHGCQNVDPAFSWTIRLQVHHARAYTPPRTYMAPVRGPSGWARNALFKYSPAGTSLSLVARTRVQVAGGWGRRPRSFERLSGSHNPIRVQ